MKFLILFLITIPILGTNVKFEYNENVNLVRFMFTLSNQRAGSILLKSIYKKKRANKDKAVIEKFKKLLDSIPKNIDLYPFSKGFSKGKIRWKNKSELLIYFAAISKDIGEFKKSLYSIYSNRVAYELSEMIDYFSPIYRSVYYNKKSKKEINKLLNNLEKINNKTNSFFEMEKRFYGSKINIPEIVIFLFPLFMNSKDREYFNKKHINSTRSTSYQSIQVIEVILPFNKNVFYGVALHETAHFCYWSSDIITKLLLQMEKENRYGKFAANYLNEGLATVIGNGYISEKMNLNDTSNWYNNYIINKYAHQLYPIIKKMFENKEVLSLKYSKIFVDIFKKSFPNIFIRREIVFNPINIITSKSFNYKILLNTLKRYIEINYVSSNSPLDHKFTIESFNKKNRRTQVFILKFNEIGKLKVYKSINLKQLKKDIELKKEFVRITFNKDRNRFEIFFLVENYNSYNSLVKKIMKLDKITKSIIYKNTIK